jgi:hypothetical protein
MIADETPAVRPSTRLRYFLPAGGLALSFLGLRISLLDFT